MRLVIKEHKPVRRVVWSIIGMLVLFAGGWVGLQFGLPGISDGMGELGDAAGQEEAEKERVHLRKRVAVLERNAEIDKRAYAKMQNTMKGLQQRNLELRQEVEFYREVLASAKDGNGVTVQGLRVKQLDRPRRYQFELIITHLEKDDNVAKGFVSVVFEGHQFGGKRTVSLVEIAGEGTGDLSFSIKHFARLEGVFILPEGFEPQRVHIALKANGASVAVERVFDWAALLA